jgi:hypothetical protein
MWRNGSVLRKQLESICKHFNVPKVNLICHSKGGIDAQAAIVHYGANQYVARVFTLSTPHWGSPLADLAYASWASWLTELIGMKSDGTYSLQTGYKYIEPKINSLQKPQQRLKLNNDPSDAQGLTTANIYAKGGALQSPTEIEIPVDSLARRINVDFLVAKPLEKIKIKAPNGLSYLPIKVYQKGDPQKSGKHQFYR